jgi:hypothetical protein
VKNLALTAAMLFYVGGASFSAVAQTEKAAPIDETKQAPAVLPDEGLAVLKEVEITGMARDVLAKLLDGLAAQCKITRGKLGDS